MKTSYYIQQLAFGESHWRTLDDRGSFASFDEAEAHMTRIAVRETTTHEPDACSTFQIVKRTEEVVTRNSAGMTGTRPTPETEAARTEFIADVTKFVENRPYDEHKEEDGNHSYVHRVSVHSIGLRVLLRLGDMERQRDELRTWKAAHSQEEA